MPKDYQYNPKGNTYVRMLHVLYSGVSHNSVFLTRLAVRMQYVRTAVFTGDNASSGVTPAG
jgi:hypothetical protein